MARRSSLRSLVLLLLIAVLGACGGTGAESEGETSGGQQESEQPAGGGETSGGQQESEQPAGGQSAGGGESCANVPVPGHEAVSLRAQGTSCADAMRIAAAALGKGRQAYEASGFSCQPSQAGGGDTNYVCTQGDARVTFRYGTA